MDQFSRNKVMKDFRSGISRILISTDLLARGIDIQQISLVVNYDLPNDIEYYFDITKNIDNGQPESSRKYEHQGAGKQVIKFAGKQVINALNIYLYLTIEDNKKTVKHTKSNKKII